MLKVLAALVLVPVAVGCQAVSPAPLGPAPSFSDSSTMGGFPHQGPLRECAQLPGKIVRPPLALAAEIVKPPLNLAVAVVKPPLALAVAVAKPPLALAIAVAKPPLALAAQVVEPPLRLASEMVRPIVGCGR
ncbi:MAG: hypothetical protein HQ581_23005 [Planctomycetes bacterium]|nr:hypothetical protein [Planctomycetota bacterium]